MEFEQLKLENQLCFPVYAASRLITREYQPYLEILGITYPQYLVMMVLWEIESCTVNEIAQKLILQTNTITPLLKRMEAQGLISRARSGNDERKVLVSLTQAGKEMQTEAAKIPLALAEGLISGPISIADLTNLKIKLEQIIKYLSEKDNS